MCGLELGLLLCQDVVSCITVVQLVFVVAFHPIGDSGGEESHHHSLLRPGQEGHKFLHRRLGTCYHTEICCGVMLLSTDGYLWVDL